MSLKGVKKLNKAIERSIYKYTGAEVECCFSNEFAIYLEEDRLNYTLIEEEFVIDNFQNFLKKQSAEIDSDIDYFVYSLLHEIGHYYTYENMPLIKKWLCNRAKDFIQFIMKIAPKNKLIFNSYFYLPDEKIATKWAIALNKKTREEMTQDIKKALMKFYQENFS